MSSFIGQLRISLGLDSAAFESGAKRAAAEVNTLGSKAEAAGFKVGSMTKALVAGAGVLAGAAIVSQLKDAIKSGLEYASSLGETAQQLGVTTKTLQEYRYAAGQVGISQEDMDNGLAKLTRTIGLAVEGGKAQVQTFDKLGISVRDAGGNVKDAGDIIPELADALQKVGSPAERAAILVELFGKSGMKMGSLLADGAKGVNSLREDAQKLGIVISDTLIAKADSAADKITSLNNVITAKISGAVAENADAIVNLTNAIAGLVDYASQAIRVMAKFNEAVFNKPSVGLKNGLLPSAADADQLRGFLQNWGLIAPGGGTPKGKSGGTSVIQAAFDEFNKAAGKIPAFTIGGGRTNIGTGGGGGGGGGRSRSSGGGYSAGNDNELRKLQQTSDEIYRQLHPFVERAAEVFARRDENSTKDIRAELSDVSKTLVDVGDKTQTQTVRIAKSFAEMTQSTVASLQNMSNSIRSGDFLSILGSAVGLFTQLASTGLFGKSLAATVNAIPKNANGTAFHPGGLTWVGERGPELVDLPRGSAIYRNGTGPGMGGNTYINYTLPSDEFWDRINAGHAVAAQAGAEGGFRKVQRAGARSLAR